MKRTKPKQKPADKLPKQPRPLDNSELETVVGGAGGEGVDVGGASHY
jgi:hypothetical protein